MILIQLSDFETGQCKLAMSPSENPIIQSYIDRFEIPTIRKLLGKVLGDLMIDYLSNQLFEGPLVVDTKYVIVDYKVGDIFTNVGAASNATGVVFTATGDTPTVWDNESILRPYIERYENLLNSFYEETNDDGSGFISEKIVKVYESIGMKELIKINIYYWFIAETQIRQGSSGAYAQSLENGKVQSPENSIRLGERKWNMDGLKSWDAIRWYCLVKFKSTYPEFTGMIEKARSVFS